MYHVTFSENVELQKELEDDEINDLLPYYKYLNYRRRRYYLKESKNNIFYHFYLINFFIVYHIQRRCRIADDIIVEQ